MPGLVPGIFVLAVRVKGVIACDKREALAPGMTIERFSTME